MQHAGANQKLVAWNDVATSRKKERDVLDVKLTLAIDSINRPSETSFGIYSPWSRRCKCCVSKPFIQDATESKSNPLSHTGLWNTCCQCSNLYLLVGPSSDLAAQAKLLCVYDVRAWLSNLMTNWWPLMQLRPAAFLARLLTPATVPFWISIKLYRELFSANIHKNVDGRDESTTCLSCQSWMI